MLSPWTQKHVLQEHWQVKTRVDGDSRHRREELVIREKNPENAGHFPWHGQDYCPTIEIVG